jgi:hypothetical protein
MTRLAMARTGHHSPSSLPHCPTAPPTIRHPPPTFRPTMHWHEDTAHLMALVGAFQRFPHPPRGRGGNAEYWGRVAKATNLTPSSQGPVDGGAAQSRHKWLRAAFNRGDTRPDTDRVGGAVVAVEVHHLLVALFGPPTAREVGVAPAGAEEAPAAGPAGGGRGRGVGVFGPRRSHGGVIASTLIAPHSPCPFPYRYPYGAF